MIISITVIWLYCIFVAPWRVSSSHILFCFQLMSLHDVCWLGVVAASLVAEHCSGSQMYRGAVTLCDLLTCLYGVLPHPQTAHDYQMFDLGLWVFILMKLTTGWCHFYSDITRPMSSLLVKKGWSMKNKAGPNHQKDMVKNLHKEQCLSQPLHDKLMQPRSTFSQRHIPAKECFNVSLCANCCLHNAPCRNRPSLSQLPC